MNGITESIAAQRKVIRRASRLKARRIRRGAKKKAMRTAVRHECVSLLWDLGYRNPLSVDLRATLVGRDDTFVRWRGHIYEEIDLSWLRAPSAKFSVSFKVRTPIPKAHPDEPQAYALFAGNLYSRPVPWFLELWGWHYFGAGTNVQQTVEQLKIRLKALDAFLREGVPDRNINRWWSTPRFVPPGPPEAWTTRRHFFTETYEPHQLQPLPRSRRAVSSE